MTPSAWESTAPARDSRVLVFSQRRIESPVWQALQYEFEDLLATWDDVQILSPLAQRAPLSSSLSRRAVNGTKHRLGWERRSPPWVFPSTRPVEVHTEHDLFFAVFHFAHQISHLHRLKGWRERSRRAACLIIELWSPDVQDNADYLHLLSQFDQVYVCNPHSAAALRALGLQPQFMAPAVDAVRASPHPLGLPRILDVYNYGRAAPLPHAALMRLVEEDGLSYLYETRGDAVVIDHSEHRALLANMMKRSKFFLTFRVNDSPERQARTGGDEALTTRYFEGMAGGAVLLGSVTRSPEFAACFDWPDAVVPVAYDETDMRGVLSDLSAQPDRLARIRTNNVKNSMLRHDWSARWSTVLAQNELAPTAELQGRIALLEARANATDLAAEGLAGARDPLVLRTQR